MFETYIIRAPFKYRTPYLPSPPPRDLGLLVQEMRYMFINILK